MFQTGKDDTEYRLLTKEGVTVTEFGGKQIVKVSAEALTLLSQQAFHDVEFMLRREHNEQVAEILNDPEASANDKYVALQFLRNAEVAARGYCPSAKTRAPPSSTPRRGNRYGRVSRTRKPSPEASTTPSRKISCATPRTLPSRCMRR